MKKVFLFLALVFITGCGFFSEETADDFIETHSTSEHFHVKQEISKKDMCTTFGGDLRKEKNECWFIQKFQCDELEGEYIGCDDPCSSTPTGCDVKCYPVCKLTDFVHFFSEKGTKLHIDEFSENLRIFSPLKLIGKLEKSWVFEGEFMVVLLDSEKNILKQHYGTANIFTEAGEIKEGMVDFQIDFEFEPQKRNSKGFLRIGKNNVSDEEGTDDWIDIPVKF